MIITWEQVRGVMDNKTINETTSYATNSAKYIYSWRSKDGSITIMGENNQGSNGIIYANDYEPNNDFFKQPRWSTKVKNLLIFGE